MISRLLFTFVLLFLSSCTLQEEYRYTPMLWKITGNNLKKPSYIFGTFHTKEDSFFPLHQKIVHALSHSDRLYTEIKMDNRSQKKIHALTRLKHPLSLKKRVRPKTIKLLLRYLIKHKLPYTLESFKAFKIWAIAMMIENRANETKDKRKLFMDEELIVIAKSKHIKQSDLETPKEQLDYFDKLSLAMQETLLLTTIDTSNQVKYDNALSSWYKKGESKGFDTLQKPYLLKNPQAKQLDKVLTKGILTQRNQRFTRRIDILLQSKPTFSYFFAVGAGHLADEKGILQALKQRGYQLIHIY